MKIIKKILFAMAQGVRKGVTVITLCSRGLNLLIKIFSRFSAREIHVSAGANYLYNILKQKGGTVMKKPMTRHRSLLSLLSVLFLVVFMAAGCEKTPPDNILQTTDNIQTADSVSNLQGTQWKLEGIVNMQTGEMQVLEPVDCEQCYTLVFDTDSTATGKASPNTLLLRLAENQAIMGIATYINHLGDEELFCNIILYSVVN